MLQVTNGKIAYLDPRYKSKCFETCILIYGTTHNPILIPCNLDHTISENSANFLAKKSIINFSKSKIFSNPGLCKAIFNWDIKKEIDYLCSIIEHRNTMVVLDVGCGYGRLLKPLYEKGVNILGVDNAVELIDYLNQSIISTNIPRGFCADMVSFVLPNTFDVAFSSMNTLRYLEDLKSIKLHLRNLAISMKKSGIYAINIMLSPTPKENYCHKWQFNYNNKDLHCEWKYESYCYNTNKIIDRVTIYDEAKSTPLTVMQEFQAQAHMSVDLFKKILLDLTELWEFYQVYSATTFEKCDFSDDLFGNHWILLKKK